MESKATHRFNLQGTLLRACFLVASVMLVSLLWGGHAKASQDSTAVSQSFVAKNTDGSMVAGALVSLSNTANRTIQLTTVQSRDALVGIISKTPLLALSTTASSQIQVAIAGDTPTFVSDINGTIAAGDRITTSPLSGVGMKATTDGQVIGTAQQSFNTNSATTEHIKDRSGVTHDIHVGQIVVRINIAAYSAPTSQFLPPFLQRFANTIAGKPVSLIRALGAGMLLLLALVSIVAVLYASTHSAITSIGRNPLAARAINKGLVQVAFAALLILSFALLASYLILSL